MTLTGKVYRDTSISKVDITYILEKYMKKETARTFDAEIKGIQGTLDDIDGRIEKSNPSKPTI